MTSPVPLAQQSSALNVPQLPTMTSHPASISGPTSPLTGIHAIPNEVLLKIFRKCGNATWKVVISDELPTYLSYDDYMDYHSGAHAVQYVDRLIVKIEHMRVQVASLYQVSKHWNSLALEEWKVPEKLFAVQQTSACYDAYFLLDRVHEQLSPEDRSKFTSVATDIHLYTFPVLVKDIFPNVSTIHIHHSRWTDRQEKNPSPIATSILDRMFAQFMDLTKEKDTLDLLNGKFDIELCRAACLSKYFVGNSNRQRPHFGSTSFTFTHVLTLSVRHLREGHLYLFPESKLAFRFQGTLRLQDGAEIIVEKPTRLIAKFFLSGSHRGTFNRIPDRPLSPDEQYALENSAEEEEDIARENEEMKKKKVDPEEVLEDCFAVFSLLARPKFPVLGSITYDPEKVHELIEANDVGFPG